ncbi:MAG: transporter [Flavobacterium sp.]|nr:MAG: transporter [Flavobacterium sp.]
MNGRLLVFSCITFVQMNAQETDEYETLVTDRPDMTESSSTVKPGSLQFESGTYYTSFEENNIKEEVIGFNTTLVRYGLLEGLELRLGWNFEEGRTSINGMKPQDVSSGFSPLLAGAKISVSEENGLLPEIALIGHVILPFSAATDYRPETTGVDFRFSLSHTLSERSSLGYNIGAEWGSDSPEAAYIYTLAYGYSIAENIGLYAELYGDMPEDSRANHYWDAGFTYLLLKNLQLDATVGSSITEGQDLLLSAGVSYRVPK